MRSHRAPIAALLALIPAATLAAAAPAAPLTPEEEAGKRIFFLGIGTSGAPMMGNAGVAATPVSGAEVACARCHGEDARGRAEGESPAPEITWSRLTRADGHGHPGGRDHPPFDPLSLATAIGQGIDPAGNPLDPVMPRFQATPRDFHCIVQYLKRVETDRDPGLEPDAVVLGTVVPADGQGGGPGSVIRKILEAWVEDVNAGGGINGRRLRLVVADYDPREAGAALAAATRVVQEERVFALVSGFAPGAEEAIAELVERERVPLVGPFTLVAREASPTNRWLFHLLGGPEEQARALVEHAAREIQGPRTRAAIVHGDDAHLAAAARAAAKQFAARGWGDVEVLQHGTAADAPSLADGLRRRATGVVLFLGGETELAAFLRAADAAAFAPRLLAPGTLAARAAMDAPASFQGRIFLSYPSAPTDEAPVAARALAALRGHAAVGDRHRAAQVSAFSAATLLAECLKRMGRGVSRERLVAVLEGLWAYEPGLVPPLTFGASRRVGARGAHVVSVDLKSRAFLPAGGWVALP